MVMLVITMITYDDDAGDYNDHIYDDNISDDNDDDDVHRRDCERKREVARFLRVFVVPPSVGRALGKDDSQDDYCDDSDDEDGDDSEGKDDDEDGNCLCCF